MHQIPVITIFVRHSADCPHAGEANAEFYKRCNCRKHLRWTESGEQKRKATKERTWAGAERVKRELELAYENAGKPAEPDKPVTVKEAIEFFLENKAGQNLRGGLGKYRLHLGRLAEFCEKRSLYFLRNVGLPDLTKYRATWESVYPSSVTRQKVQERLRSFFRYALNADFIAKNPAAALSPIKVDVPPTLPLEPDQYQALLDKVPEVFADPVKAAGVRAFIRCMRYSALAIGDTACLERTKIHHDTRKGITRIVTSREKTGVHVGVAIPPDVVRELETIANGNQRYVFWPNSEVNPKTAATTWGDDLRPVFHAAGMPKGHSHQLRDTAAVEWLNAGIPLEEVSRLLGHRSIKTTERHYNPWVKSRQDRLDTLVMATWNGEVAHWTVAGGKKVIDAIEANVNAIKELPGFAQMDNSELVLHALEEFLRGHRVTKEQRAAGSELDVPEPQLKVILVPEAIPEQRPLPPSPAVAPQVPASPPAAFPAPVAKKPRGKRPKPSLPLLTKEDKLAWRRFRKGYSNSKHLAKRDNQPIPPAPDYAAWIPPSYRKRQERASETRVVTEAPSESS
jgi:site-specific recombinase XerD